MSKLVPPVLDLHYLDMHMPEVKPGELLCDGCWAVSDQGKAGWMSFNFKHLKQSHLCPVCVAGEKGHHMCSLQRAGM